MTLMEMAGISVIGMMIWMIGSIIFLGLLIYTVYLLISKASGHKKDESLEILKKRYARGEIDEEEYERRKNVLTGK
jgi:putative membrane protein